MLSAFRSRISQCLKEHEIMVFHKEVYAHTLRDNSIQNLVGVILTGCNGRYVSVAPERERRDRISIDTC